MRQANFKVATHMCCVLTLSLPLSLPHFFVSVALALTLFLVIFGFVLWAAFPFPSLYVFSFFVFVVDRVPVLGI